MPTPIDMNGRGVLFQTLSENEDLKTENEALKTENEALSKKCSIFYADILKRELIERGIMDIVRQKDKQGIYDLLLPLHYRQDEWASDDE
tara:strand:+ start:171 stop:440 length:270 start_codon:yes stop_codon:yes gene_type:complete